MNDPNKSIVIVGSGLAGTACAVELSSKLISRGLSDYHIYLLEKEPRMGGNSMKASSGINSLCPETGDTIATYESDVLESGGGLASPSLVHKLVHDSQSAIEFLGKMGVELPQIVQLGGHSVPRTHSANKGPNVGFLIMKALLDTVQTLPNVTCKPGCKLVDLLFSEEDRRVQGVRYIESSTNPAPTPSTSEPVVKEIRAQAVVLATGGFGANRSMLERYCGSGIASLATTNGLFSTGDGVEVAERIGADLVQMDQVQVHPTGFVDPSDPAARTRFLAPEKLRGVGGILLSHHGRRFVDELATRERLVDAIGALHPGHGLMTLGPSSSVVFMLLPEAAVAQYGQDAVKFYCTKGLFTAVKGCAGVAEQVGCNEATVREELRRYNRCCRGEEADDFGKRTFPCAFDVDEVDAEASTVPTMYVARVTPVVHYCMGGVRIDDDGRVGAAGSIMPISGLFAAGEVTGGLHGKNRLAGNSLLECVVFGRRAAGSVAAGLMQQGQAQSYMELEGGAQMMGE